MQRNNKNKRENQQGAALLETALLIALLLVIAIPGIRQVGVRVRCAFLNAEEGLSNVPRSGLPVAQVPACGGGGA